MTSLCDGLQGDCTINDPYVDYPGALRCLMEGSGDVAFTKHTIPLEYTKDGTIPADWSNMSKVGNLLGGSCGGPWSVPDLLMV
jgi:hypothetical protein